MWVIECQLLRRCQVYTIRNDDSQMKYGQHQPDPPHRTHPRMQTHTKPSLKFPSMFIYAKRDANPRDCIKLLPTDCSVYLHSESTYVTRYKSARIISNSFLFDKCGRARTHFKGADGVGRASARKTTQMGCPNTNRRNLTNCTSAQWGRGVLGVSPAKYARVIIHEQFRQHMRLMFDDVR